MPLYNYPRDKHPDVEITQYMRRPVPGFPDNHTVAMHWDGTYRDRLISTTDDATYWTEEDYDRGGPPWPVSIFAKHLESREETDHRLGYLSDNERELLSDLQHQQF